MKPATGECLKHWPVWRTLTIGEVSKDNLANRLKDGDFLVSDRARDVMSGREFTTLSEPMGISLVRLKVRDLGFMKETTTTDELFRRAEEYSLDLCPAEVGPHLRLTLTDQPRNDGFSVVMEPIADSDGNPHIFYIWRDRDGWRWLSASGANRFDLWNLVGELVFCLRK